MLSVDTLRHSRAQGPAGLCASTPLPWCPNLTSPGGSLPWGPHTLPPLGRPRQPPRSTLASAPGRGCAQGAHVVDRHWPTNRKLRTEERPSPGLFNRAVDADRNEGRREGAKSQAGGKASFEHGGMDCSGDARAGGISRHAKINRPRVTPGAASAGAKAKYLDTSCFN